jgi:acyl carrier protein
MSLTDIENRLRELLLPVLGLDTVEEVPAGASLVNDLGADSLDFVEITYLIEQQFGVALKTSQLVVAGADLNTDDFFQEGRLTEAGAAALQAHFPNEQERFRQGMSKVDLFQSLTVRDLAAIIEQSGGK